jgi:hypothetical protein
MIAKRFVPDRGGVARRCYPLVCYPLVICPWRASCWARRIGLRFVAAEDNAATPGSRASDPAQRFAIEAPPADSLFVCPSTALEPTIRRPLAARALLLLSDSSVLVRV